MYALVACDFPFALFQFEMAGTQNHARAGQGNLLQR